MAALDLVRQSYYTDAVEQRILWTEEIKENYTKLLQEPLTDYYFRNEEGCLSYYGIRPYQGKNGFFGGEHIIKWKPFHNAGDFKYYYVDAVTGELLEADR